MIAETSERALQWLTAAAEAHEIHTVRASWVDRLGTWRGKRLPVEVFLRSPERRISFCDGMIVVDINCDVHQGTPFSNFDTGYPDMYLRVDLDTLAPVGWSAGEAFCFGTLEDHSGKRLTVAPMNVLEDVVARLAERGVELAAALTVSGRLMLDRERPFPLLPDGLGRDERPPGLLRRAAQGLGRSGATVRSLQTDRAGGFRFGLASADPLSAARRAVLVKAALKEISRRAEPDAVFMTVLPGAQHPSLLDLRLTVAGANPEPQALRRRLTAVRALLQPSVNAFKAGPCPELHVRREGDATVIGGFPIASEADPATALMAVAAAIGAGLEGGDGDADAPEPQSLEAAAALLDASGWAREWLGDDVIDNAVPLLRDEGEMFRQAVTDWELDRYWSAA